MKKIVLLGFVVGIIMLVLGFITSSVVNLVMPGISEEYKNPQIFRPWSDPLMSLYFVQPFIVGCIISFIWDKTKKLIPATGIARGMKFGVLFWLVTGLTGMFISYSTFQISFAMICSWMLSGFVQSVGAGIFLSKVDK